MSPSQIIVLATPVFLLLIAVEYVQGKLDADCVTALRLRSEEIADILPRYQDETRD